MCGIVAYIGKNNAVPFLIGGLKRLEYRGYDSVGISFIEKDTGQIKTIKQSGSVEDLKVNKKLYGNIGIGHTRWATHGKACKRNAHPHVTYNNSLALVHNGIIENYKEIKNSFRDKYTINSDTDSEVLLYLIYDVLQEVGDLYSAVKVATEKIIGAYAFILLDQQNPDTLICGKKGSSLCVGINDGNYYVASDISAFNKDTNHVITLEDGYISKITKDKVEHYDSNVKNVTQCNIEKIYNNAYEITKENYSSFMLKEIYEQPNAVSECLLGRINGYKVKLGGFDNKQMFIRARRITILGCGSSWHAGLLAKYYIEELAGVGVNVEYASEFRYRDPVIENGDIVIGVSQSGETADTIAALRLAKEKGAITIGVCNTVNSEISRMTECGIYTRCGIEVGVASTKAFTNQCLSMLLLALFIDQTTNHTDLNKRKKIISGIKDLPILISQAIKDCAELRDLAERFYHKKNCLFLGRGYNFPIALEGALKLKEISYIHAEGYPAAEMKHGPIALIDNKMPVVVIANNNKEYNKILNNKIEIESRGGQVIAILKHSNEDNIGKYNIKVPDCEELITPFMSVIPLQLFSLHCAEGRGCNVDKPRNLAKSVTVE
jgi:glutamine---fructose-6-phosphate transaminase (isomerizing)